MTRDIAAVHADLKVFGAAIIGAPRTAVWCYTGGTVFHVYETTTQDSGTIDRSKG